MNDRIQLRLPIGKLPMQALARLLETNLIKDRQVIVGPEIGEDAAVIDTGGSRYLLAKTDPITFATDRIGWYAVHINANDIAVMGGRPLWYLVTLLLPQADATEKLAENIMADTLAACSSIGVSLVGGHTEITSGLTRPIVVGQMLGEVEKKQLVRTSGAREGDAIVLTKGIAIEGTAIIARDRPAEAAHILDQESLAKCRNFLDQPGISVLKEALIAANCPDIHAMHDPTEGGVATALHELAWAAGLGLTVEADAVPVYAETRALCEYFNLDPLGVIASGALLIVLSPGEAKKLVSKLESQGITAGIIGKVTSRNQGIKLVTADGKRNLPLYERDELTRLPPLAPENARQSIKQ